MSSLSAFIDSAFDALIKGVGVHTGDFPDPNCPSKDPEAQLEILESVVELVQTKVAGFLQQIQSRIASTRKQRNALRSPIYRIPVEILTKIFFFIIETSGSSEPDGERDKVRSNLLCVAWPWFNIITSTPLLSSFLSNLQSISKTKHLLDLSRNVTIDVTCTDYRPTLDVDEFMQLVLPHIHRWRSFRLNTQSTQDWGLPTIPAPSLETLEVTAPGYTQQVSSLFGGDAPRLRVLKIRPLLISWDTPLLSGLTELIITDINGEDEQWRRRYYDLFKALPLLEHVNIRLKKELRFNTTDSDAPSYELGMEPIVLSRIRTIDLENLPSRIGVALLSSIVGAPPYPCLSINFTHAKSWLFESMSFLRPNSILPSVIPRMERFMIWFKLSERILRLRGSFPPDVLVPVWDLPAPLILKFGSLELPISPEANAFIARLATSSLKYLSLYGRIDVKEAGLDLGKILLHLSSLEVLSLHYNDNEGSVHSIFAMLQTLSDGVEQGKEWPCAMLRELKLDGVRFQAEHLLGLINFRYGRNSIDLGIDKTFLKELEIKYCGPIGENERKVLAQVGTIVLGQGGIFSFRVLDECFFAEFF